MKHSRTITPRNFGKLFKNTRYEFDHKSYLKYLKNNGHSFVFNRRLIVYYDDGSYADSYNNDY